LKHLHIGIRQDADLSDNRGDTGRGRGDPFISTGGWRGGERGQYFRGLFQGIITKRMRGQRERSDMLR